MEFMETILAEIYRRIQTRIDYCNTYALQHQIALLILIVN